MAPVLAPIERISLPSRRVFEQTFMAHHRPVVLTDVFRDQPIDSMSTMAAVRARLGDLPIGLSREYFSAFLDTGVMIPEPRPRLRWTTLGDYLDLVDREPGTPWMCTELPTPEEVSSLFEPPACCGAHYDEAKGLTSFLFLGNQGNVAHLHFDGDLHHVLLHQVAGDKRVTLIQPAAARLLDPMLHWSLTHVEGMSEGERARFLHRTGGREVVLHPGETLYMPPLVWHHVEYLDAAFGFNLRFGLDPLFAPLRGPVPDMLLQNVVATLMRRMPLGGRDLDAYRRLVEAAARPFERPMDAHAHRQAVLAALHADLCAGDAEPLRPTRHCELIERNVQMLLATRPPDRPAATLEPGSRTSAHGDNQS